MVKTIPLHSKPLCPAVAVTSHTIQQKHNTQMMLYIYSYPAIMSYE